MATFFYREVVGAVDFAFVVDAEVGVGGVLAAAWCGDHNACFGAGFKVFAFEYQAFVGIGNVAY